MITSASLPPHITPTLPTLTGQPTTTTPSGLIVPGGSAGETRTPSGLIVISNQITPVSRGSQLVIADGPLTGDGALKAARDAHAELSGAYGQPAADTMLGHEVEIAERVNADERRLAAIKAFLEGNLAAAVELIKS